MPATFVVVPQWQGSGSARAMRLIDGALAIRGDLPATSTMTVEVPSGAGSSFGTLVQRLSAVQYVRDELRATLLDVRSPPIVIGGDCGIELAAVDHANADGDLALLWIDAHPDFHTPQSSPSGAFHGMVLRTLTGDGPAEVLPEHPLPTSRVILAGTRALDDAESGAIAEAGIRMISPEDLTADAVTAALIGSGASRVYIHVDLDALDPSEFACITHPEPFGLTMAGLLEVITAARTALPLAGAGITEFAPGSPDDATDDLPTILRIVGAMTRPLRIAS